MVYLLENANSWLMKRAFNKRRAAFYRDLGAALNAGAPLRGLINEYALHEMPGISPMMAAWAAGLQRHPDSLARATEGLVLEGDTIVIAAAEANPDGAGDLYDLYAQNLAQRTKMVKAIRKPLMIPAATLLFMVGILFFFKTVLYADMVKSVPVKYWPDYGAFSYNLVQFVTGVGGMSILGAIIVLICWIFWSIPKLTGEFRDFLDRRIVPYTLAAQMDLISVLIAIASMIRAGISDTAAIKLVTAQGNSWMSYQIDLVKAETGKGKTVLTSLQVLPLPQMLSARIVVLAREPKLADRMPDLVIQSCLDQSAAMLERMEGLATLITVGAVIVLMTLVGILMLGNVGFAEAQTIMSDAMSRKR